MLIAQAVIAGTVALAIIAGLLFAIFGIRRDGSTAAMQQVTATVLEAFEAYLGRVYLTAFAAAVLLAVIVGAAVGGWERSLETGALAGGALMVGSLIAAIPGIAGSMVLARGPRAAAAAAQRGASAATGTALRVAGAAAVLSGALALGGIAGTFGIYSALLDKPVEDAPGLMVAFALGAALVAGTVRIAGVLLDTSSQMAMSDLTSGPDALPSDDPRNPGVAAAMVGRIAGSAGVVADVLAALVLAAITSMVISAALYNVTGEIEWLLLPLSLQGAGLIAGIVGVAISSASGDGRPSLVGPLLAALVSAASAAALCFALVEDDWWWFAASAAVGVVAAFAVFLVHRSASRTRQTETTTPSARAAAATLVVLGATVLGAYALGEQGANRAISETGSGIYGVLLAAVGFLMPAACFAAVAAARPLAEGAHAMARIAFDAEPETGPAAKSAELGSAPSAAGATGFLTAATLLATLTAVFAFLQLARIELGQVAAEDPSRYATLAQDLGLTPPGSDLNAAIANAVDQYGQRLADASVAIGDDDVFGERAFQRLAAADRAETTGYLQRLIEDDDLSADDLRDLETGPYPLPRILPLNLSRADAIAGVLAGIAFSLLTFGGLASAGRRVASSLAAEVRRQFLETAGIRTGEVRADYARAGDAGTRSAVGGLGLPVLGTIILPPALAVGLRYAFGGEGNEGWVAAAAFAVGFAVAAALLALLSPGKHGEPITRRASVTEAAVGDGLVVAAEVSVTEYSPAAPGPSFEASAAAALPALSVLTAAAMLAVTALLVG